MFDFSTFIGGLFMTLGLMFVFVKLGLVGEGHKKYILWSYLHCIVVSIGMAIVVGAGGADPFVVFVVIAGIWVFRPVGMSASGWINQFRANKIGRKYLKNSIDPDG